MGGSTEFECACGRPPTHGTYDMCEDIRHFFCCACWIKAGEPPVEWCDGCLAERRAVEAKAKFEGKHRA